MPTTALSNFNLVCTLLGSFVLLFGVSSYVVKERLYISEALPALVVGAVFKKANVIRPEQYGNVENITREFSRLVIGVQLVMAGVQLPAKYLQRQWRSLTILLGPVMTVMWIVSSLIVYLCIPGLRFIDALIIASCVTPTDPVLCNSLVNGKFAEKYIAEALRELISAESGANDGLGYPFLFLALCIIRYKGTAIATNWIVETMVYQIILCSVYGIVLGYVARVALQYVKKKRFIDHEYFVVFMFAFALFIIGTAGMFGTDDLLACFIAGNVFTWDDWYRLEIQSDHTPEVIDTVLNILFFSWVGATAPWTDFSTTTIPAWRYIVMGLAVIAFRRLPAVLACYKFTPGIENFKEAVFAGYFGPIGAGAIFYLGVTLETLATYDQTSEIVYITKVITPIIYFLVISSIIVHGITIRTAITGTQLSRTLSRSWTNQLNGSKIPLVNSRIVNASDIQRVEEPRTDSQHETGGLELIEVRAGSASDISSKATGLRTSTIVWSDRTAVAAGD
ncbi:Sodium/hydrogen exchanger family-domain-containing protein [Limtongia smithiae]|uniref:Sodium/hydrogen exchanger family-domain-containing protein n=1 Tax=Limtongia smithiae TaxID=1125753 RepID=UPI0034CF1EBC